MRHCLAMLERSNPTGDTLRRERNELRQPEAQWELALNNAVKQRDEAVKSKDMAIGDLKNILEGRHQETSAVMKTRDVAIQDRDKAITKRDEAV